MNNKEKQLANYPLGNAIIHNMVKGGFAGCAEVLVSGQILWALKARLQAGEPFTMNPMILYRGLMPHLLGRLPITAAQITGAEITMGVLSRKRNDLTLTEELLKAVTEVEFLTAWEKNQKETLAAEFKKYKFVMVR